MLNLFKAAVVAQFEASLCMLDDCLRLCPAEYWVGPIAKYSFWQVAYHTLCFVELYLSPGKAAFQLRDIHPAGWAECDDAYPSRRFSAGELVGYAVLCREKAASTLAAETRESLEGPSGFSHLPFSRGELHLYNLRHLQHHTGQRSAYLRRVGESPRWVKAGWEAPVRSASQMVTSL